MARDYGAELDEVKKQLAEIQVMMTYLTQNAVSSDSRMLYDDEQSSKLRVEQHSGRDEAGHIYYAGQYRGANSRFRWEPQQKSVAELIGLDGDKAAKILAALGHKQRIDILKAVLHEPLTGAELVERLNMGTTGQLYHHIRALQGSDLLAQEERGGKYTFPGHRALPFLLLLTAASELLDTSDYMELAEARDNAGAYLGTSQEQYDPHLLLRSVLENTIMEHQAGYCSNVSISLHSDGSVTVADNGRGIPVQALPNTEKPRVQAVLTEISRYSSASIHAPNGEKGISIPIVNALSQKLTIEVRRDGKVYRQEYKHGIPQTALLTVGLTNETGTSLTLLPDKDIFLAGFEQSALAQEIQRVTEAFPGLNVHLLTD